MKLYTEEQVDKMLSRARMHKQDDTEMFTNEYLLSEETPIELPSDEEIRERAENSGGDDSLSPADEYENGAKWMKEQILNQNK